MAGDTETDVNDNVEVEMDVDIVVTDGIMCGKCLRVYSTKRKLSQHKRDVHDQRPLDCPEPGCNVTCLGLKKLKNHQRSHKMETCGKCQTTMQHCHYVKHIMQPCNQPKVKKTYECPRCDHSCGSQWKLDRHLRIHDRVKVATVHECGFCTFSSPRKDTRDIHEGRCPAKKRLSPPSNGPITKAFVEDLFSDCNVSINDFNDILARFVSHFGEEWFDKVYFALL